MSTPPSDDDLRRQVQQLGRHEGAGAPAFHRILTGSARAPRSARGRLRPAVAIAGAVVVAAIAAWWPSRPAETPTTGDVAQLVGDPAEEWVLPSDRVLADAAVTATRDVEQLSREIDGLLRP